jgi:hypothetical protein
MGYKSVNPNNKEFVKPRKWADWKKGDFLLGKKVECKELDKYKKPIFAIVTQESNFGAAAGETVYLNCGGNFRAMIEMVEDGETCRIEYRGMNKMGPKSSHPGEMSHDMDVQIPSEETAEDEESVL